MLQLKNIKKSYKTGEFIQHALTGISLDFEQNEFVAILGASGSGKTTLLNIIGGLDRYDEGDLIINGKSTKEFKDSDWDAYRNNCIGFIFQSYNLIGHISVLDNVEMGMTLSGVSSKEKKERALAVLKRVGLEEHANKKPNQLSGGQMQRVAIARALANDPDIILADEPTGALDTETSIQIMELIKEISKDKLVIMVTHNPDLAEKYANRIVRMQDGELIDDSDKEKHTSKKIESFKIKKTAMSFLTALKLSFHNIVTKKGRTLITAFASSIGIIGIALILALSNGFDIQIDKFEQDTLSSMPIMISEQSMEMDEETMKKMQPSMGVEDDDYPSEKFVYPQVPITELITHKNNLTKEYMEYIEKLDANLIAGISYYRATGMNLITKVGDQYKPLDVNSLGLVSIPKKLDETSTSGVVEDNYDILAGKVATKKEELMLVVDSKNHLDTTLLEALGVDASKKQISFDDLLNIEIKLILNDDYYRNLGTYFTINSNFQELYESENALTLKIVGIVRGKEDKKLMTSGSGLTYTESLVDYIIEQNSNSNIVLYQKDQNYNVLTGQPFTNDEEGATMKENILAYLGADTTPLAISIYPKDFETKGKILNYLDKYNEGKELEDSIQYMDLAAAISSLSENIMDAITIVLIAFSAISLVVSSIMIGIITYISVLERTKEIGVLRSLGARKKDIRRVFNAETFIIGVTSGALGIIIARILVIPTNIIIENITDLGNVAKLNPLHALALITISVILTVIGGYLPARMASKKDPVIALRTE